MRVNLHTDLELTINGREVVHFKCFTYLGGIVTTDGAAVEDVNSRIKKANGAFVQLYPVWRNTNILVRTKIRFFNTNVKSVLLYGCETWKITERISNSLQVLVNRCLERNLNVKWLDKISNEALWQRTKQKPIEQQINERKWRWIGLRYVSHKVQ